jgi:hypothetical protein
VRQAKATAGRQRGHSHSFTLRSMSRAFRSTSLTGTLLRRLRVLQWLAHGSNGSHAALITPRIRVQKLDQFPDP